MKARRIAALLTAALLSLTALTACSGGGKDQGGASGGLLAQIKERGEIIVAMEGTWSPGPTTTRPTSWWATTWRWLRTSRKSWG